MRVPANPSAARYISIDEIADTLEVSRAAVYRLRRNDPSFPRPVMLAVSRTKKPFLRSEFDKWHAKYKQRGEAA